MESANIPTEVNTIQFATTVQLYSGMDCLETEIHSLSLMSAHLSIPKGRDIKTKEIYRLNIPIEGARAIAMSVMVTQVGADTFDVKWTQIDMESFAILKRTIELNSNLKNQVRNDIKNLVVNGELSA
ncbi:hypothetical protein [Marinicella rhabdoformis]|uniref:hypothetical protein n=1 Tax=Marinicella rhabdoformis TaxID=2580566 RepID=UPI0012AEDCCD|nr:hypothetical protein [Marinicella rhabdoformis]